jgi:hypothetical protein
MYCKNCGRPVDENSLYCNNCGCKLDSNQSVPKDSSNFGYAVLGFFIARFIGGASLSKLFACFLIVFGISRLFLKGEKQKKDV